MPKSAAPQSLTPVYRAFFPTRGAHRCGDPNAWTDPDKVNFFFDGMPAPFDPGCTSGDSWDWTDSTHKAISFCNEACETLASGGVDEVSAEFGCSQVTN